MNYRIAGRVIIPDDTGKKILLVEQVPEQNFWIIPGGGVEEGETSTQAAIRELREETGLEVELVRLLWCSENYSPEFNHLSVSLIYLGRRIGGELGSSEHRTRFFDLTSLTQEARYPCREFWQLLASHFANTDSMGTPLLSRK